ncbi:MAG: peroxiredoxin [Chitinophagaceae bacterium]
MSLHLGDTAPNFQAKTTQGDIDLYEYLGDSWGLLFSHPSDFTPICTTELGKTAALNNDEFPKRNVKVLALSVDSLDNHNAWIQDIEEVSGEKVNYPIVADEDRKVSELYDFLHPNAAATTTVRSVVVIGPDKKIKLTITYPPSTGRNFNEILRAIDSLQLTANYGVTTPANWEQGQDVVVSPAINDEDAKVKFPKGFKAVKPYLRYTPQPNI